MLRPRTPNDGNAMPYKARSYGVGTVLRIRCRNALIQKKCLSLHGRVCGALLLDLVEKAMLEDVLVREGELPQEQGVMLDNCLS
jgi:hypothetical protein